MVRTNDRIRAREVRVVQEANKGEEDINHGSMQTSKALELAKSLGLDLVEIAPHANPPVCRICDYGRYKYEKAKMKKEQPKQKGGKTKEIKFRVGIEEHDYLLKMRRSEQFLGEGNKLRMQLMFRGRQMAHKEIGFEFMTRVIGDLKTMAQVEQDPRLSGRFISMQMAPLPAKDQVKKFTDPNDDDLGDEDDEFEDEEE